MRTHTNIVAMLAAAALVALAPAANAQTGQGQGKAEFIGPNAKAASSTAVKVPATGHMLFLAGHTASKTQGSNDYGNFDTQFKAAFAKIETTLKASGGALGDIVQLSVFLTDMRYQPQFAKLAGELFKNRFPAVTYIEVNHFSDPQLLMEIQPIAVVP